LADVAHSSLTGADLHEPKGVATAASGTAYIADGAGSGAWSSIADALSQTGMIADFGVPVVPTGWLECDGSAVSRTTYATLFAAVTIQQTGTRTNGSAIVTGLSSTTDMKVGYFLGGTGIPAGTTILTVDGATQITMSANATSSGSATVIVSPWALGDASTTFNLPNVTTSGRFRRSRTSSVVMGTAQADALKTHTHTVVATGTISTSVNPTITISDSGHTHTTTFLTVDLPTGSPIGTSVLQGVGATVGVTSGGASSTVGTTASVTVNGTYIFSGTPATSGNPSTGTSTETRPLGLVVMTCIKT
jgi:microcystin-dependent protein